VDGSGNVFVLAYGNGVVTEIGAVGNFGSVNVGASSATPLTLYFTFDTGGTLGSTAVLTKGAPGLDFTDAGGGTCTVNAAYNAGDTCTVNVTFAPKAPGPRYGAAELLDGSGNLLATGNVQGTGVGPQATFATIDITSGAHLPSTTSSLGSGFYYPQGVAVDGNGNVFVADTFNNAVKKLDFVDPPSLSFAATTVGSQSSDSPQSVTVSNVGNADLTFPVPLAGNNPGVASGFTLDGSTTCPRLSTISAAGTLAAGTSCAYGVDFIPVAAGTVSGSMVLTDNNLNAAGPSYATQSISLSGTATGQAPAITQNPSSQKVTAGSSATFTAAATGIPTPTVQWQVSTDGGGKFSSISGATSTTLSFSTTASQNGYQYRAVFTNSVSSVPTTASTLTVNVAPTITVNPSNQAVPAGSTATFTAAASGNPAPTVQWQQLSSKKGATFSNIAGATSTTLSVTATNSQNGYQYRAVFTNFMGTATTTPATLTSEDFTISASPASQTISSGNSAVSTVSLASVRGLTGNVAMTCSGGPANSTCAFSTNPVILNGTATTKVTVFAPKSVKHSTFTLTFTGTLGNITHSTQVSLTVN
jgi:hypothetical protein